MMLFGFESRDWTPTDLFTLAQEKQASFRRTPMAAILDVLDAFGREWRDNPVHAAAALDVLRGSLPFSEEMVRATLDVIPALLSREALTSRLQSEFGAVEALDRFLPARHGLGLVRAFPVGEILHVTAGNVFVSCIDSLLMGFLTKNVSYVKLSSKNNAFPLVFARALVAFDKEKVVADKFCLLSWKGGDAAVEDAFKTHVPAILAWGGEEMLESYRRGLAPGTKLLDYGPKISFQVLTRAGVEKSGLQTAATAIARDLTMWDQQACSSPQNLFVEKGVDVSALMAAIGAAMETPLFPRGQLSGDEHVELHKERERARVSRHLEGGLSAEGRDWMLHHETRPYLRSSPLNRTLILKDFVDTRDLLRQVAPFRFYLQTCGYLTGASEKAELLGQLGAAGIKRFSPLGRMSESFAGLPHDGRYGLTELVNLVPDEAAIDEDGFLTRIVENVPFYRAHVGKSLADMPLTDGAHYAAHDPAVDGTLVDATIIGGRYFASGGSTGKPKHVLYSNEDLDRMCDLLADNFRRAGVRPGTKVANLFAAGTLYSSFLAVDKYCEKLGLTQLPIGGLADPEDVVKLLAHHRPEAVFGLPGLIIHFAEHAAVAGIKLTIPMVFFAGENLSVGQKNYLREHWGTHTFWSAGYASVDAGVVGWQCAHAQHGVHHVADPHVRLEIVDGEGVVTSFVRTAMPVIRYRTGDRMSWVEGPCECGDASPRFRLLGRMDGLINIWASRLALTDIAAAVGHEDFQVLLTCEGEAEVMEVRGAPHEFACRLHEVCADLRKTTSLDYVVKHVRLSILPPERNVRSGKAPRIVDRR
jgi:phenylacetate-CoA ligase